MRKKFLLLIFIFSFLIFCIGCENKKSKDISSEQSKETEEPESTANNENFYNYYTGEKCLEDDNGATSFMAMIENSTLSRPQSGLSDADIIYETSAEGGIPRFIALFHTNKPSVIGPIRSVRPYFIDIAKEFNLPFAHCGGSDEALKIIEKDQSLVSINEISNGSYFWRDKTRKAPHNLYTSFDNIQKYLNDKNKKINNSPFNTFNEDFYNNNQLKSVNSIDIIINNNYSTNYTYKDGYFLKFMDSKEAMDKNNNKQLAFTNIIIQKTDISLSSDKLHLNIRLSGEGEGLLLSKGKILNIKWKKTANDSKTTLYDTSNNEVPLSPGKTIWHIVDSKTIININ